MTGTIRNNNKGKQSGAEKKGKNSTPKPKQKSAMKTERRDKLKKVEEEKTNLEEKLCGELDAQLEQKSDEAAKQEKVTLTYYLNPFMIDKVTYIPKGDEMFVVFSKGTVRTCQLYNNEPSIQATFDGPFVCDVAGKGYGKFIHELMWGRVKEIVTEVCAWDYDQVHQGNPKILSKISKLLTDSRIPIWNEFERDVNELIANEVSLVVNTIVNRLEMTENFREDLVNKTSKQQWWFWYVQILILGMFILPLNPFLAIMGFVLYFSSNKWVKPRLEKTWQPARNLKPMCVTHALAELGRSCPKERIDRDLPLHKDCEVKIVEEVCEEHSCTSYGVVLKNAQMVVPNPCSHSMEQALRVRIMFEREYDTKEVNKFIDWAKGFVRKLFKGYRFDLTPDLKDLLKHKPYSKSRKQYMMSREGDVMESGDWVSNIFPKDESYQGKNSNNFKTRVINGRGDDVVAILSAYFEEISHSLEDIFGKHRNQIYDKRCTPFEIGLFADRCASLGHIYEADCSNWDGSVLKEIVDFELWMLDNVFNFEKNIPNHIRKVWSQSRGVAKGVKFEFHHARRSGDLWTSSFNSLLNLLLVNYLIGEDTYVMVRGDDNFFGVRKPIDTDFVISMYRKLGFECKLFKRTLDTLEYCSGQFYPVHGHRIWGVKPGRVLAKLGLNFGKVPKNREKQTLLGTAISMKSIAQHVPILSDILTSIENQLGRNGLKLKPDFRDFNQWSHNSVERFDYDSETVDYFLRRYDITYNQFLSLLGQVDELDFTKPGCLVIDSELLLKLHQQDTSSIGDSDGWKITPINQPMSVFTALQFDYVLWISTIVEEILLILFHYYSPLVGLFAASIVGGAEAGAYWTLVPWFKHIALFRVRNYNYALAFFLHCAHNYWASQNMNFYTTMTRKTKIRNKGKQQKSSGNAPSSSALKSVVKSAVAAGLRGAGSAIGSALGGPVGGGLGYKAGAFISKVIGSGDYSVSSNSLMSNNSAASIPAFNNGGRSVTICHREYLGEVVGSTGFNLTSYSIQPGSQATFPYLSGIASQFQQYRIKGMLFCFNSTCGDVVGANNALGTVIMSTQYNPVQPNFTTKMEMSQYEFTNSAVPTESQLHPIECAPSDNPLKLYKIRMGSLPADESKGDYDFGTFQIATQGMQASNTIGELWVTYEIELLKPRLEPGGRSGSYIRVQNSNYDNNNVFSAIQTAPIGTLEATISSSGSYYNQIKLSNNISAGRFLVCITWIGASGAVTVDAQPTLSNLTGVVWQLGVGTPGSFTPVTGNVIQKGFLGVYDVNGYNVNGSTLTFSGLTLPTGGVGSSVTVTVVKIPSSTTFF